MKYVILQSPLPPAESVINPAEEMAWTEIAKWSSAAVGILLVVMILKSFRG